MRDPVRSGGRRAAGELESDVLGVLWAAPDELTSAQVNEALPGDLAHTTVMTIMARLHDKGMLIRRRVGRGYAYTPVRDEAAHTAEKMVSLLEHGSDREAVLARFVSELSERDEQLMQRLLRGDLGH
ncbi:BlaI/MecI/CopY family transcriptional regulator [Streptomyces sp. So13.3]|uniref:BlaI/MecI/CopY family transcriptional regulator n=1 Tax=Streptomyces TaxID=1883 RepID=UPI00110746DD|nr:MULTISPECIES: BlaI/MecI/CopY family transcriptional regulator [unclassified Streptomyces]MCZ4103467.1 BlaI/MecI/CopY family transcriptional regulator [Streptomyces sp. H39-C1]QNA70655.1 BlaI/MecI/CopY family transcriptional regulator [Streptomyces sp. So13.3]